MIEYAYSFDEEQYHEDIESAIDDAFNTGDYNVGDTITIYRGKSTRATHKEFIWIDEIIESMQDRALDNYNEWADDYLTDLTHEKVKQLESVIVKWFEENSKKPRFYTVTDVEKIEHVIEN